MMLRVHCIHFQLSSLQKIYHLLFLFVCDCCRYIGIQIVMSTRSMRLPIVLLYSRIQNSSARIVQVVRFLLDNIMPRVLERSISSGDDSCRVIWSCSWVMDDGLIKWRVERLDGSVRLRLVYEHNFTPENCSISLWENVVRYF